MDGDYDFWVDLLAESYQILFGGMTGCVKVFFDKASSFLELFYKVIQLLVKSCISFTLIYVPVILGIYQTRFFRLAPRQNLLQIRLELFAASQ